MKDFLDSAKLAHLQALLAHWFMGESIAREVQALDWIDQNFDAIVKAIRIS